MTISVKHLEPVINFGIRSKEAREFDPESLNMSGWGIVAASGIRAM